MIDSGKDVHERALASSILSHQGMDLAATNFQIDTLECSNSSEPLSNRASNQQRLGLIRYPWLRHTRCHRSLPSFGIEPGDGIRAQRQCMSSPNSRMGRAGLGSESTGRLVILDGVRRVEHADSRLPPQAVDPDLAILGREIGQQDAPGVAPAQDKPISDQRMTRSAKQHLAAAKLVD